MASSGVCGYESSTDGITRASQAARASGRSSWPRQPAKKIPSAPTSAATATGCSPSHSPGWPPQTRREPGCSKRPRARAKARTQDGHPLGGGEAADEDEHRPVAVGPEETVEVGLAVGHRPGSPRRVPAPRLLDQPPAEPAPPVGDAGGPGPEPLDVDAVGDLGDAFGVDAEHRRGAGPVVGRDGHEVVGGRRLPAEMTAPPVAVPPRLPPGGAPQVGLALVEGARGAGGAGDGLGHRRQGGAGGGGHGGPLLDGLEELDLGAVQVGHERDRRPRPAGGVVLRGQVVEVEHRGPVGAGRPQRRLPDGGQAAGQARVEDSGRRARAYELTAAGKQQLLAEAARWQAVTSAVNRVLRTV